MVDVVVAALNAAMAWLPSGVSVGRRAEVGVDGVLETLVERVCGICAITFECSEIVGTIG